MPSLVVPNTADAPAAIMQGIAVPAASVQPEAFMELTRRLQFQVKSAAYAGLGSSDNVDIRQTGIISGLHVRLKGDLVVTLGGGTAATTAAWPYGLLKNCRFTANGQSNLINCGGEFLKAREFLTVPDLTDRGVDQAIGGAYPGTTRSQGTMSLASETWGVGSAVTAITGAPTTYSFDLEWFVPVAMDQVSLTGAIFAQTASTDLQLVLDWASSSDLFVTTGAATAVIQNTQLTVTAIVYSIPQGPNGDVLVPDLSTFHSLIQTRVSGVSNGENEFRLAGQGVGRRLQRLFWRIKNGSTPAPLAVNDTNYGAIGWRYGGNDTPEVISTGGQARHIVEKLAGVDLGAYAGWVGFDWTNEWALRDSIDQGAATELRFFTTVPNALSLTSAYCEYVQETLFAGGAGA